MKPVKQTDNKLVVPTDSTLFKSQKKTLAYLENQTAEPENGPGVQKVFSFGAEQMSTLSMPVSGDNDSAEKNSLVMAPTNALQTSKQTSKLMNFFESRMPVVKLPSYNETNNLRLNIGQNDVEGDMSFFVMQNGLTPTINNKPNQTFSRLGSLQPEMDVGILEKPIVNSKPMNFPGIQFGFDNELFRQPTGSSHDEFSSPTYQINQLNMVGQNSVFKFPHNVGPIGIFPPMETKGPKLQNFNMLFEVLVKIFCDGNVSESDFMMMDSTQETILNSFLMRKFFKKLRTDELSLDNTRKSDVVNRIISARTSKRPEEFFKFVLTRVIKTLKKSYKSDINPSGDLDIEFYSHYFKDVADKLKVSIDQFFYPLTGKATNKNASGQKKNMKLNAGYYSRIFQSKKFLDAMNKSIEEIKSDYADEIRKKLESLLMKWDSDFDPNSKNMIDFVNKIAQYLEKNKRCKLPWTLAEVAEATDRFDMLVESVLADLDKKGAAK
jgi:hypothetical protein